MIVISYVWKVYLIDWLLAEALSYLGKHTKEIDCYD